MSEERTAFRVVMRRPLGGIIRRRWVENIILDFRDLGFEGVWRRP